MMVMTWFLPVLLVIPRQVLLPGWWRMSLPVLLLRRDPALHR
jgi:hypothetical protein